MADLYVPKPTAMIPRGVAVFPHLNTPDGKFKPENPVYSVNVRVGFEDAAPVRARVDAMLTALSVADPAILKFLRDDDAKRLTTAIANNAAEQEKLATGKIKTARDLGPKPAEPQIIDERDDDGSETGNVVFKTKANSLYKNSKGVMTKRAVKLFDAKGRPTTAEIGGGSVIKTSVQLIPWVNAKCEYGVKLGLEAVQVIELRARGGSASASEYGFDEEDGYDASDETAAGSTTQAGTPDFGHAGEEAPHNGQPDF